MPPKTPAITLAAHPTIMLITPDVQKYELDLPFVPNVGDMFALPHGGKVEITGRSAALTQSADNALTTDEVQLHCKWNRRPGSR